MTTELRPYTPEQMGRLTQFRRAEGIVQRLLSRQPELDSGVRIVLFARNEDNANQGYAIDAYQTRAMLGALTGMYMECMDLGLKEELHG